MSRFTLLDRLRGSVLAGSVGTSASEDKLLSSHESHPGVIPDYPGISRGLKLGSCLAGRHRYRHRLLKMIARRQEADRSLTLSALADDFTLRWGGEYGGGISPRWVGSMLRKRLGIQPQKSQGVYVIPIEQYPRLEELKREFGIVDTGDDRDTSGVPGRV